MGMDAMGDWKLGEMQYNTYLTHWLLDSCWRAEMLVGMIVEEKGFVV